MGIQARLAAHSGFCFAGCCQYSAEEWDCAINSMLRQPLVDAAIDDIQMLAWTSRRVNGWTPAQSADYDMRTFDDSMRLHFHRFSV